MIGLSISGNKFHFDIPIRPADKRDGHTNGLMVVLQPELLHHLDRQHVHLKLREPPPDAHPRAEAERNGSEGMGSVLTRTSAQPALRLELPWFGEVLLVVHGEQVPVGDHRPSGDLAAAMHKTKLECDLFQVVEVEHCPLCAKHVLLDRTLHPLKLVATPHLPKTTDIGRQLSHHLLSGQG